MQSNILSNNDIHKAFKLINIHFTMSKTKYKGEPAFITSVSMANTLKTQQAF